MAWKIGTLRFLEFRHVTFQLRSRISILLMIYPFMLLPVSLFPSLVLLAEENRPFSG